MNNYFFQRTKKSIVDWFENYRAKLSDGDLNSLAKIYRTDKFGKHFYTEHYGSHFERFRDQKIKILEIGVGGYKKPYGGGKSLRMWKQYFPLGQVYAIDIHDKSGVQEDRIKIWQGDQTDADLLEKITTETGPLDLIIDDGSHQNDHVITTFKILFPKLKDGGIYVVEDTQTSYWENYGGDSHNLSNPRTMLNFFKSLTDCLNHEEFILPNYQPTYFDKKITSIHFYHNMVFIYKGNNNEKSNIVKNNQIP